MISEGVTVALIVGGSTIIQALIATLNHADTRILVQQVTDKVEATHTAIDGRMEQLIAASIAQGRQDQRAETRQDAKDSRQDQKDDAASGVI
jgi:hypothetical protein